MRMWELANFTPFPCSAGWERDAAGHSHYVVTLSARFRAGGDGRVHFHPDQIAPRQSALYEGDDPNGLLLEDAELGLPRDGVDILLAADAMLDGDAPQKAREIALTLGDLTRRLYLLPPMLRDRRGHAQLVPGPSGPVALDWRAAWGGGIPQGGEAPAHPENPLGTGALGTEREALPRLADDPGALVPGQPVRPFAAVSPGPIPRGWPQRARLAGTFDDAWSRTKAPLLPDDYDPAHGHAASPGQVHPGLTGGEEITLSGALSPAGEAPWRFALPALSLRMESFHRGAWTARPMRLQRVLVDARGGTLRMIWNGALTLARIADDVRLRETRIRLTGHRGFAVLAADAARFHRHAPDPTQEPVA